MNAAKEINALDWINQSVQYLEGLHIKEGKPYLTCDLQVPADFPCQYTEKTNLNESPVARLTKRIKWMEQSLKETIYLQVPKSINGEATPIKIRVNDFEVADTGVPIAEIAGIFEDSNYVYIQTHVATWVALGGGLNYLNGKCLTKPSNDSRPITILPALPALPANTVVIKRIDDIIESALT